ncbi:fungal-specific transcription factor domain-containing protein [Biscogniauxia marginata]|nr:fungal-specific transcription factor domain-containing protein [Biscogniauxia marginata]
MDPGWMQYITTADKSRKKPPRNRACEECRRKKTRCDMRQPTCSLCGRIGIDCTYPSARRLCPRRRDARSQKARSPAKEIGITPTHSSCPGEISSTFQPPPTYQRERSRRESSTAPYETNPSQTNNPGQSPTMGQASSFHGDNPDSENPSRNQSRDIQQAQLSAIPEGTPDSLDFDLSLLAFEQSLEGFADNRFAYGSSFGNRSTSFAIEDLDWSNAREPCSRQVPAADDKGVCRPKSDVSRTGHTLQPQTTGGTGPSHCTSQLSKDQRSLLSIHVPADVADHLVELFFERVQGFLPLLHRPKLYLEIFGSSRGRNERYQELDLETALLLNGMFALSARFSTWNDIWTSGPKERGEQFAKRARALRDCILQGEEQPTLRVLQGCILVTYYELASGASFQTWLATGACCRMAYGLTLHAIDRNPIKDVGDNEETWLEKEEKRRAWWAVFQLDNLASLIASRPFTIDSRRMDVMLPVADDAWFSNIQTPSVPLFTRGPSEVWRSLQGCANQNPYAWFLVCSELTRAAYLEFDRRERSIHDLEVLQSTLHCFALSLPPQFSISSTNMIFDDDNYVEKNWVMCTIILLQGAHIFVAFALELENSAVKLRPHQNELPDLSSTDGHPDHEHLYYTLIETCDRHIKDQLRALRLWSPDFISLASPLIACALIGPGAVHAATRPCRGIDDGSDIVRSLERQTLEFALRRFEQYWALGTSMQDILKIVVSPSTIQTGTTPQIASAWVQGLTPNILQPGS